MSDHGVPGITPVAVLLVLLSAGLHTTWNYVLKRVEDKRSLNAWLLIGATLWGTPAALWALAHGARVTAPAFVLALCTSLLWVVYYGALARSYERGDLSVMYPVARGVSPVAATAFGLLLGERPTLLGSLGIAVIVLAVWSISGAPIRFVELRQARLREAMLVGLVSALYSAIDDRGVALCPPVLYFWITCFLTMLWLTAAAWRTPGPHALLAAWRARPAKVVIASLCDFGAYLMVLLALAQAHVMYVVPLRASAVLFSVLAGGWRLGEPNMGRRLAAAAGMVAGIALLAIGG